MILQTMVTNTAWEVSACVTVNVEPREVSYESWRETKMCGYLGCLIFIIYMNVYDRTEN